MTGAFALVRSSCFIAFFDFASDGSEKFELSSFEIFSRSSLHLDFTLLNGILFRICACPALEYSCMNVCITGVGALCRMLSLSAIPCLSYTWLTKERGLPA